MKFNNKTFLAVILVIIVLTYSAINILPGLYEGLLNTNSTYTIQKSPRIDTNELDITGMDVITRSDKVYYQPDTPIPTNKIWSSAVFKGQLTGLYTFPFASNTGEGNLNITIPEKQVYSKLIAAQIIGEFISLKGNNDVNKVSVKSFDDLSVQIDFFDMYNNLLFTANFIQGSPYIFIKPNQNQIKVLSSNYTVSNQSGNWIYTYKKNSIGIFTDGQVSQYSNDLQVDFQDPQHSYLTIAYINDSHFEDIKNYSKNIIDGVSSEFSIKDSKIEVKYNFNFRDPQDETTIFGLLPHQYQKNGYDTKDKLFTLNTVRGDECFVKVSKTLTYSIPRIPLVRDLNFETMSGEDKSYLSGLIEGDLKDIVYVRSSAYFGGNDILKLATLLQISDKIDNQDLVNRIKTRLMQEFNDWFTFKAGESGKHFAFDEAWGGILGYETSGFGGENYNDHHFQYGYFINAASILASYDNTFIKKYGNFVNNLIGDIATVDKNSSVFPYLRYFDQYEGHSWATGFGDFSDGNNQESTSEAINAWYSIWLWSQIKNDSKLKDYAEYLYSSEINSARTYWLNWSNNTSIFPKGYEYNKVSLVWGGRVEYQTFFSLEPQSIEGIQYLPFTPGSLYLYNKDVLQRDYNFFSKYLDAGNSNLSDMNYLYYAMLKGFDILPKKLIETMKIDIGNSRANLFYWTKFWNNISSLEPSLDAKTYTVTYKDGSKAQI